MANPVMTLRMDPELLERLRAVAQAEERSVSSKIVSLVRKELDLMAAPAPLAKPTMGWLGHAEVPDELAEIRSVRSDLSRSLKRRVGSGST